MASTLNAEVTSVEGHIIVLVLLVQVGCIQAVTGLEQTLGTQDKDSVSLTVGGEGGEER